MKRIWQELHPNTCMEHSNNFAELTKELKVKRTWQVFLPLCKNSNNCRIDKGKIKRTWQVLHSGDCKHLNYIAELIKKK